MKLIAFFAIIVASVFSACSPEPATTQTQHAATIAPTANSTATIATTEAPVEQPTTESVPPTAVEPTRAPMTTSSAAQTPEPTTAPTDVPQPLPTIHTSEINILAVAVAEIPANVPG